MPRPILIIARDEPQRRIYAQSLRHAGFSTIQAADIDTAITMMRFDCIGTSVFDFTLKLEEQHRLVEALERVLSPIHLVYIGHRSGDAKQLVRACKHCAGQHGPGRFYSINGVILTVTSRAEWLAKSSPGYQYP